MNKKELVLGLLLMVACCAYADRYKVLYVNSSDIKVGGKAIAVGSVFDEKETVRWTSEQQAMKVVNLTTNRVMVFVAKALEKKNASTLYEYLIRNKHLSTRGLKKNPTEEWQLDETLYLLDTLYISLPPRHNQSATAKMVVKQGREIPLTNNGHHYVIPRSLLGRTGSQPINVDIVEYDKEKDWSYTVYRNLNIEIVPQ